jgi:hypothetical protein
MAIHVFISLVRFAVFAQRSASAPQAARKTNFHSREQILLGANYDAVCSSFSVIVLYMLSCFTKYNFREHRELHAELNSMKILL